MRLFQQLRDYDSDDFASSNRLIFRSVKIGPSLAQSLTQVAARITQNEDLEKVRQILSDRKFPLMNPFTVRRLGGE